MTPTPAASTTAAPASTAQAASTTGVVRDSAGGAVSGAVVTARTPTGNEQRTVSAPDGRFTVSLPAPFELTVLAGGFAPKKQSVTTASQTLDVVLSPATLTEQVTVTATRGEQRLADVPASVTVLTREDIRQSGGSVADSVLKQLPQFSLFRRSSSLAVHPTSQGISLRGIGPSGVSRSLVLVDGVPYNDPFGGWVYWTGIPMESADRIEVVDNSSSSLYGNYAMGGVINILTANPAPKTIQLRSQYSSRGTPKVDLHASHVVGKLGVSLDTGWFETDGFPNVVKAERRPTDATPPGVDNKINARFKNVGFKAQYAATDRIQLFGRVGYFREERDNGKASTYDASGTYRGGQTEEANDTTWKTTSVGAKIQLPDSSSLNATLFTDNETFKSNFLAVPFTAGVPVRSIGRISLNQVVPTKGVGGMVQWTRSVMGNQVISAGTDFRWVKGESQEQAFNATINLPTPTVTRFAGGTQKLMGAFVQDIISVDPKLQVTLSARIDHWRNYNPHFLETTTSTGVATANNKPSCTGTPDATCLSERADTVASPRIAALYHVTNAVSVWADYGYGFRAPTLNELYRQFAVGVITTRANNQLKPERLKGGDIGINVTPMSNLHARVTWFDNRVKDPVANVTLATPANTQQRQNLGRTRIAGIQTDVDYQFHDLRLSGGYLFERAKVVEADLQAGLPAGTNLATNCPGPNSTGTAAGTGTGKPCYLAQVPKNRATFRASYMNPKYVNIALSVQMIGRQFDDDQNARVVPNAALAEGSYPLVTTPITDPDVAGMPKYTLVDLNVSRALCPNVDVFFSAENLWNRVYFVGTVPTLQGPPRMITGGFRLTWSGK